MPERQHIDPTSIADHESAERERQRRAKDDRKVEAADVKWLMSSRRGRRIVWRFLAQAGVYRSSFNANSMTMAFNEGARNSGLRLLDLVHEHCADAYPTMVREAQPDERSSNPDE